MSCTNAIAPPPCPVPEGWPRLSEGRFGNSGGGKGLLRLPGKTMAQQADSPAYLARVRCRGPWVRMLEGGAGGFSLLETVIVVSLLGIMLAIGLPSYVGYASNQRGVATAHTLALDLRVAQQEAIARRASVEVRFPLMDAACHTPPAPSYVLVDETRVIKRTCFPADVDWATRPPSSLVFDASGTAQSGATLVLQSTRTAKAFSVTVTVGTGVVSVDPR